MQFEAKPKIQIDMSDIDDDLLDHFDREIEFDGVRWVRRSVVLDVDAAEKAVAWLKAHGVEQIA